MQVIPTAMPTRPIVHAVKVYVRRVLRIECVFFAMPTIKSALHLRSVPHLEVVRFLAVQELGFAGHKGTAKYCRPVGCLRCAFVHRHRRSFFFVPSDSRFIVKIKRCQADSVHRAATERFPTDSGFPLRPMLAYTGMCSNQHAKKQKK